MTLVELIEIDNERASQERAAIKAYVPRFDELGSPPAPILVPKAQRLDVDATLARFLPKTLSQ